MPSILKTVPLPLVPSIPGPERRGLWHARPTAASITCINSVKSAHRGGLGSASLILHGGGGGQWGGRELGSAGLAIASDRTGI